MVDLVAMDDVGMFTNYAHCDWLLGAGSVRDVYLEIENDFMLSYSNKGL